MSAGGQSLGGLGMTMGANGVYGYRQDELLGMSIVSHGK